MSRLFFVVSVAVAIVFVSAPVESGQEQNLKTLSRALDVLVTRSADTVDEKSLLVEGIHGMLRTLDPYTQFLDEEVYDYMQDQQKGSFFGIGISFDIRDGELVVIAPIEGSPAWKLGLRPGDIIVEIDGETTAKITNSDVIKKLRGDRGSKVRIGIKRHGLPDLLQFEIVRDRIALNSVRGGFFVAPHIGYVRITEFTATTGNELGQMINKLVAEKVTKLIVDLRYNSGGLLSAAEDVASFFLRKGDLIVSTHGRQKDSDMELRCRANGQFRDLPLIILVNSGSASSSEIVAGAVQDHNRGLIIGTNTHGKGLVGTQFPTDLNTALQITTAQYFTPAGKFIQKPYRIPHRDTVHSDQTLHFEEFLPADSNSQSPAHVGGIVPDIDVKEEELSVNLLRIESISAFFNFIVEHGENLRLNTPNLEAIPDSAIDAFIAYCRTHDIPLKTEDLDSDRAAIQDGLLREAKAVFLSPEEGERVRVINQTQIREAIKAFETLETLLDRPSMVEKSAVAKMP